MVVKIRFDSLIFVGLTEEQVARVEYCADNCTIVKDLTGWTSPTVSMRMPST